MTMYDIIYQDKCSGFVSEQNHLSILSRLIGLISLKIHLGFVV